MKAVFAVVPLAALVVIGGGYAAWSYFSPGDSSIVRANASPADRSFDLAMECLIKKAAKAREARMSAQALAGQCSDKAAAYAAVSKMDQPSVNRTMISAATRLLKR